MGKHTTNIDVAIVGAGASGIYAAKTLKERGVSVLVLEATERIGGRLFSKEIADRKHYVELGGQWLAKEGQTRLNDLITRYQFKKSTNFQKGRWMHDEGSRFVAKKEGSLPMSFFAALESFKFVKHLEKLAQSISLDAPWSTPSLDQVSLDAWLSQRFWLKETELYWRNQMEQALCCDLRKVSLLEMLLTAKTVGNFERYQGADHYFFAQGLANLFVQIVKDQEIDVRLNAPVHAVKQYTDHVEVTTANAEIDAKVVLFAVPPQTLRKIAFDEPLPETFANMLVDFVQGTVVKVVGVYAQKWWRDRELSGLIMSQHGPFDVVVDSSFDTLEKGILVGLVTGSRASKLKDLNQEELKSKFEEYVQSALGAAPPLEDFLYMDWNQVTYTQGAYSSKRALGHWLTARDALQSPFGRVYFAGTETAREWRGYVEGALESGERQARQIADLLASETSN
jgi:monoamine oxidase